MVSVKVITYSATPSIRASSSRILTTAPHNTSSSSDTKNKKGMMVKGRDMYVAYTRFGEDARDVLRLCEHESPPTPNHKNGEVLIKVLASTISITDCEIRRGEWWLNGKQSLLPPIIPGAAFVGNIQQPQQHYTEKKQKKNNSSSTIVMALIQSGSNARFLCLSKDRLVKVPPKVAPDRAVCLAETYLSAFQALHLGAQTRPSIRYRSKALEGKSILILEGYSSLGKALIEVAVTSGADRCYALADPHQHLHIARLGAIPLSYNSQHWWTQNNTNNTITQQQIDVIVAVKDNRGLYTDQVTQGHLNTLKNDGRVIVIGQPGVDNCFPFSLFSSTGSHSSDDAATTNLMCQTRLKHHATTTTTTSSSKKAKAHSYNVFDSQEANPRQATRDLEHLLGLLEREKLSPEILDLVSLEKVATVQSILESKRVTGHIVCTPWAANSS